nr:MAG TPA: Repressor protein CI [Caudoviricetes sp.]
MSTRFVTFFQFFSCYYSRSVILFKQLIERSVIMPFNTMLKTLRLKKGLTQGELAKLTGLTRSAIGMYESGNREPKYEVLELLADFFNVDMNTLLDKNENEQIPVLDDLDIRMLARKSLIKDPQKAKKLRQMVEIILADDEDDD